jgi:hypothetical protein
MFTSEQYRAKAAEYVERAKSTGTPNETLEYHNLALRFSELADNQNWVERNSKNLLHSSESEH